MQYGLGALKRGQITVADFIDFNAQLGGFDGDGYPQSARHAADFDTLRLTYEGGFVNGFNGAGLANVPIITQRGNASATGDIHDTMQDLVIRARLQRANGRADNQIIWTSSSEAASAGFDLGATSLDVINAWLDNIAADPATASIDKVVNNRPALAVDACWDKSGRRIAEPASTARMLPSPDAEPIDRTGELALRIKLEYEAECYRQAEARVRERLHQLQSSISETVKSVNRSESR